MIMWDRQRDIDEENKICGGRRVKGEYLLAREGKRHERQDKEMDKGEE